MRLFRALNALLWVVAFTPSTQGQGLPDLRILPLGDSITQGSGSSDWNGYRQRLRTKIQADSDVHVDMIGTLKRGNMEDNDHEGHSGKYLADIMEAWKRPIRARPNIVLIHGGTNNMDLQVDVAIAPLLMEAIVDGIWDSAPDATIVLMDVIWANDAGMNRRSEAFNQELAVMVQEKQREGKHIVSVSADIGLDDLSDRKHPNDVGYYKMSEAWYEGIMEAHQRGWLSSPVAVDRNALPGLGLGYGGSSEGGGSGVAGCAGGNWERRGVIFDNFRVWEQIGSIRGAVTNARRDKLILADLNNDGIADYILADDDGTVRAWINGGSPNDWTSLGAVNPSWSTVTGSMIRMADVDNDGRADLIVIANDGSARVWKNVDNGKRFTALDSRWATGLGESGDKIRIVVVDGDGYADYVIQYDAGAVKWARNTGNNGQDSSKRNWEETRTIAPGPAGIPFRSTRLYDLNGDGLVDYVIVYPDGSVKALMNTGNLNKESGARNWDDLGTIAPGVSGVSGDMVRFADMDGDGLADFLAVAQDGSIRMWKNLGPLGSKGRSIRFADLTGNGRADVISVESTGRARAWLNKGLGNGWDDIGEIAPGPNEDMSTKRVLFEDVNGDGRADYVVVAADSSVRVWLNSGNIPDAGKDRIWQTPISISPGVGEDGRKIHFADLNGDGYADYLVVYDGGAVRAYLNNQNIPPQGGDRIWQHGYTIATGVGEPGSKVRFADITGDGRDEYVILYNGGAAIAYNNTGNIPDIGRARNWYGMGTIAGGVTPQGPVQFADVNGDGKQDYLVVFGDGRIMAWINTCDWRFRNPNDNDGGGSGLGPLSTCADVKNEESSDGTFRRSLWNALSTTPYWSWWLSNSSGARTNTAGAFASSWGHDSVSCSVGNSCNMPNGCSNYNKEEGSGQAHLIMKSLENLHDYFRALREAVAETQQMFNSLSDVFYNNYFPEPETDDVAMNTLFGILGPLWDIGTTLAGTTASDAGSIAIDLSSIVFTTISEEIQKAMGADEEELSEQDEFAEDAFEFLRRNTAILSTMHDDLLTKGHYETDSTAKILVDDLFMSGRWLDRSEIPILNDNQDKKRITALELGTWFFDFLHAKLLNWCWTRQTVFVVGIEMSRETFDSATGVDDKLKLYRDGKGYFIQSYQRYRRLGFWALERTEPPGWEKIEDTAGMPANFGVPDVMRSSIESFHQGGFGYTGSEFVQDTLTSPNWDDWKGLTPRLGGTFNIPVCELTDYLVDADGLIDAVQRRSNNAEWGSTICHCWNQNPRDKNDKRFMDYLPHGQYNDCGDDLSRRPSPSTL